MSIRVIKGEEFECFVLCTTSQINVKVHIKHGLVQYYILVFSTTIFKLLKFFIFEERLHKCQLTIHNV